MNQPPKTPRLGPDGCIYALCPACGTPGTRFAPVPGAYIQQICPKVSCRLIYHIYVWPSFREVAAAMLSKGALNEEPEGSHPAPR
jgi:hypothetical protein